MVPTPDATLVDRLRAGDAAAFDDLVRRHHGRLRRLARMFVSTEASADEVVQDTWVIVLDSLDRFEGRSSLATWITRILVNRAKTKGVREARSVPMSSLGDGAEDGGDDAGDLATRFRASGHWATPPNPWQGETPEAIVGNQQAMGLIEAGLRELPEKQRQVVVLRDIMGWDAEEVCNALEVNETNQRVLLHRARTKIWARLDAEFKKA